MEAAIERSRAALAAGQGLDAVLTLLDGSDTLGGSLSGPGISFAACRAETHAVAASDHPLGRRLTVDDRGDALICRFLLDADADTDADAGGER